MEDFKSPTSRLVRLFKTSRDKWKAKALDKQRQLRAYQVKVRDLEASRDRWKHRAQEAEKGQPEQTEAGEPSDEGASEADSQRCTVVEVRGSHHELSEIRLTIRLYLEVCSGCRTTQRALSLIGELMPLSVPSYTTVLNWVYRLGLYLLSRAVEQCEDWIFVIDHTMALGQSKCLVILGISASKLAELKYRPSQRDMQVLALEVSDHSTGEVVAEVLHRVSARVGQPVQIVADHGSDLRKGIELFCAHSPETVYTYDISHHVAVLLKRQLGNDARWKALMSDSRTTRAQVQQTELAFLLPPAQRSKARFMNLDNAIEWAQRLLAYHDRGNFSTIARGWSLSWSRWEVLLKQFGLARARPLCALIGRSYDTLDAFREALEAPLGATELACLDPLFWRSADAGYRRFMEYFAWVLDYRQELELYAQLLAQAKAIQTQLKTTGLHRQVRQQLQEKLLPNPDPRVAQLTEQLLDEIDQEAAKVPEKTTWLASSDIIESVFGKYKNFTARGPLKEIGKLVLTIPAFVGELSDELLKQAIETVRTADVQHWIDEHLGKSMLAKRREALIPVSLDTETA